MLSKSKIPVRDLSKSMFNNQHNPTMEHSRRSRRDNLVTFAANFNPRSQASERSKSLERNQRSNEKNKELRYWVKFHSLILSEGTVIYFLFNNRFFIVKVFY